MIWAKLTVTGTNLHSKDSMKSEENDELMQGHPRVDGNKYIVSHVFRGSQIMTMSMTMDYKHQVYMQNVSCPGNHDRCQGG